VGGDAVENLLERVAGDGRLQLAVGQLQRQVETPPVPAVDDGGERLARSDQQASRRLDRLDRRREADADGGTLGHGFESLERNCEMRASLVAGQGVDLVDDDRLHGGEGAPGPLGGQVQVERLRRGDEQARGPANHRLPFP
jgi:hypothetical protein